MKSCGRNPTKSLLSLFFLFCPLCRGPGSYFVVSNSLGQPLSFFSFLLFGLLVVHFALLWPELTVLGSLSFGRTRPRPHSLSNNTLSPSVQHPSIIECPDSSPTLMVRSFKTCPFRLVTTASRSPSPVFFSPLSVIYGSLGLLAYRPRALRRPFALLFLPVSICVFFFFFFLKTAA